MATKTPNLSHLRLLIVEELIKEYQLKAYRKRTSLEEAEQAVAKAGLRKRKEVSSPSRSGKGRTKARR